ncbi:hypothetical protein V5O48_018009 [Marasmius crinis-equi]|uniref:SWIM-type domain-containing protein n=1 Tax=Marasmius crinis-equi TaxID=585013 RepID=A0ABR3EME8_9AGAR
MTPLQVSFKQVWAIMRLKAVDDSALLTYQTDIHQWTCRCRSQKYNRHHVCKHLVHAVESSIGKPSSKFWIEVTRRRVQPLYQHAELQGGSLETGSGSITDGDDNIYAGGKNLLKGGGGWKGIVAAAKSLVTRKRKQAESDPSPPTSAPGPSTNTRRRLNPPVNHPIDSNSLLRDGSVDCEVFFEDSSEVGETHAGISGTDSALAELPPVDDFLSRSSSRATTPSNYEEDEINNEIDEAIEEMLQRADELEEAARIIREQTNLRNRVWFKSLARRDIGRDISNFVSDIKKHTRAHIRANEWADGSHTGGRGKGVERRRVANTMGYQMIEEEGGKD